ARVWVIVLVAAPPEKDVEWSEAGAEGASRFLGGVWRIVHKWRWRIADCGLRIADSDFSPAARSLRRKTHQTIKRVAHDIGDRMNFNTAVAAMMELTNEIYAFG